MYGNDSDDFDPAEILWSPGVDYAGAKARRRARPSRPLIRTRRVVPKSRVLRIRVGAAGRVFSIGL
jgi:hypothetical protein